MKKGSRMELQTTAVGMDLGDRFSHWCALNAAGEVLARGRMRTTPEAIPNRPATGAAHAGRWKTAPTRAGSAARSPPPAAR